MNLEQTWRWYGPDDTIGLSDIKQAGATGIVTALHHVPIGDIWTVDEINKRKQTIEQEGLKWSVIESIPVHEDIKRRTGSFETYIERYKESIQNVGAEGIETVCYNFMPILDWTRTDLDYEMPDGSTALRFDYIAFAAFELFILERPGAREEYSTMEIEKAEQLFNSLDEAAKNKLTDTILLGLPGSEEGYTLDEFQSVLKTYDSIDEDKLRHNLYSFLKEIIPVAEKAGVRMAIHPDDPPFSLLGLPRIVSTAGDIEALLNAADSHYNGITLCTGSYGARADNDLKEMVQKYGDRIHFVHLRSVQREDGRSFHEANHLEGDGDLAGVMLELVKELKRREQKGEKRPLPMRPDHGHRMIDDLKKESFPGYSCIGRLRGLAELRGLEFGIRRALGQ